MERYQDVHLDRKTLRDLNSQLSEKIKHLQTVRTKRLESIRTSNNKESILKQLEVSCKRMYSNHRSRNIVIVGLRYIQDWHQLCVQLQCFADYLGLTFNETDVVHYEQNRIPARPEFSRLVLTFKKMQMKQAFIMKFRHLLDAFEMELKELGVQRTNPTKLVPPFPNLPGCKIFMQDDIASDDKKLYKALRKVHEKYPQYIHCYIKDSKVYYRLNYRSRPSIVDTMADVQAIENSLERLTQNKSAKYEQLWNKTFRSGTLFPYEMYRFNRSRPRSTFLVYRG
ncbi:hypothetical protein M8J76_010539 [Diaphorina citri]|nr:hypothetical protein M8J76_010539 [Diaphorina citri]